MTASRESSRAVQRPRLLLLRDRDDDVGAGIEYGATAAGWDVRNWPRHSADDLPYALETFHTVLAYGPHNGSLLPAAQLLLRASRRPRFVWWLCENAPDPTTPVATLRAGATVRWWGDRLLRYRDGEVNAGWRSTLLHGQRHRILAELLYFRRRGLLDRLVVTSAARSRLLQRLGFTTMTLPLGYHPGAGRDLGLTRDIDVLFFGRLTPRREAVLRAVADGLKPHGVRLEMFTGGGRWVEGDQRTELLNRAKILVNVLRTPGDFTSHRFVLGMANRALIVSEALVDASPYRADEHFVAGPPFALAPQVLRMLQDEDQRRAIADRAHTFVTTDLSMARLCADVLA